MIQSVCVPARVKFETVESFCEFWWVHHVSQRLPRHRDIGGEVRVMLVLLMVFWDDSTLKNIFCIYHFYVGTSTFEA